MSETPTRDDLLGKFPVWEPRERAADCGHTFASSWNEGRNPFPLACPICHLTRCWRCEPCHNADGTLTEMGKRLGIVAGREWALANRRPWPEGTK